MTCTALSEDLQQTSQHPQPYDFTCYLIMAGLAIMAMMCNSSRASSLSWIYHCNQMVLVLCTGSLSAVQTL